ncbi:MAG: hypothetical protein Fur0039_14940 [Rhodocyclaceae bacterium]
MLEEHDEFEHLTADIITTKDFGGIDIQRFLALWWAGHIVGSGRKYRACFD